MDILPRHLIDQAGISPVCRCGYHRFPDNGVCLGLGVVRPFVIGISGIVGKQLCSPEAQKRVPPH